METRTLDSSLELKLAKLGSQNISLADEVFSVEEKMLLMGQRKDEAAKQLESTEELLSQGQDQSKALEAREAEVTYDLIQSKAGITKL